MDKLAGNHKFASVKKTIGSERVKAVLGRAAGENDSSCIDSSDSQILHCVSGMLPPHVLHCRTRTTSRVPTGCQETSEIRAAPRGDPWSSRQVSPGNAEGRKFRTGSRATLVRIIASSARPMDRMLPTRNNILDRIESRRIGADPPSTLRSIIDARYDIAHFVSCSSGERAVEMAITASRMSKRHSARA